MLAGFSTQFRGNDVPMFLMFLEGRLEGCKELLRITGWKALKPQPRDELFLLYNMPLANGDVTFGHSKIFGSVAGWHGSMLLHRSGSTNPWSLSRQRAG